MEREDEVKINAWKIYQIRRFSAMAKDMAGCLAVRRDGLKGRTIRVMNIIIMTLEYSTRKKKNQLIR